MKSWPIKTLVLYQIRDMYCRLRNWTLSTDLRRVGLMLIWPYRLLKCIQNPAYIVHVRPTNADARLELRKSQMESNWVSRRLETSKAGYIEAMLGTRGRDAWGPQNTGPSSPRCGAWGVFAR